MKSDIKIIMEAIIHFRNERDWSQYHSPRNLAMNLSIESGELLENFLWDREPDRQKVKEELADVLYSVFLLAYNYDFDIPEIVFEKLEANSMKYPIVKVKGSNRKYDQK